MKHFVGQLSIFVLQNNIIPEPGLFCQLFLHKSLIIRTTFTFYYYLLKSRSVSPLFMLPQQYLSRLNRRLMTKFRFHLWFTSRLKFRLFNWSGSFVLLLSCLKSNIWLNKQHLLLFAIFMGRGGGERVSDSLSYALSRYGSWLRISKVMTPMSNAYWACKPKSQAKI